MKRKLMLITHDLAIGGLQQVVVNICKFIDRRKFDVSVLCLRDRGAFTKEVENMGIPVTLIPQPDEGTDYLSFLKVANILKKEKIEIIHTHNTQPFVDGTIGALLSHTAKTIVHTDHARLFPDKRRYMVAERLMSHFAYRIVGVSDHTCQNLIKYEKISPRKVMTIPNGIDVSKFSFKIDRKKKKNELGLTGFEPIIGLCARLTEQKGISCLLDAMPKIMEHFENVALVIAGDGPVANDLRKQAELLGINRNVHFIGPRMDIAEILKLFNLYAIPSLWEGLPIALLEAMAAGCPIVATDVGGIPKIIKDGHNGFLVQPMNSSSLSDRIIMLLKDKKLCQKYVYNGLILLNNNYSAELMVRKYEMLYSHADV